MSLSFEPKRQKPVIHGNHELHQAFTGPQAQQKAEAHVFANITGGPQYPGHHLKDKNILTRFFANIYQSVAPDLLNITFISKMVEQLVCLGLYDEALSFMALGWQAFSDKAQLQQIWNHIQRLQERSREEFGDKPEHNRLQKPFTFIAVQEQINALEVKFIELLQKQNTDQTELLTRSLYFRFKQVKANLKQFIKQNNSSVGNPLAPEQYVLPLQNSLDRVQKKLETALLLLLFKTSWQHTQKELKIVHPLLGFGLELDDELEALLEILSLLQERLHRSAARPTWHNEIAYFRAFAK